MTLADASERTVPRLLMLFQFLQQEWNAIPQQTLVNLVQSMRQRSMECVAADDGHTHY